MDFAPETVLRRCDGDDGVEEHAGAVDDVGQFLVVHVRHVALKRRRLDRGDGQHSQQERVPADRVGILADDHAAGFFDGGLGFSGHAAEFRQHGLGGFRAARAGLGFARTFFRGQPFQDTLGHGGGR